MRVGSLGYAAYRIHELYEALALRAETIGQNAAIVSNARNDYDRAIRSADDALQMMRDDLEYLLKKKKCISGKSDRAYKDATAFVKKTSKSVDAWTAKLSEVLTNYDNLRSSVYSVSGRLAKSKNVA